MIYLNGALAICSEGQHINHTMEKVMYDGTDPKNAGLNRETAGGASASATEPLSTGAAALAEAAVSSAVKSPSANAVTIGYHEENLLSMGFVRTITPSDTFNVGATPRVAPSVADFDHSTFF
jgi:hypothetical protein